MILNVVLMLEKCPLDSCNWIVDEENVTVSIDVGRCNIYGALGGKGSWNVKYIWPRVEDSPVIIKK